LSPARRAIFLSIYVVVLLLVFVAGLELVSRYVFQFYVNNRRSEAVYDARGGWIDKHRYRSQICKGEYFLAGEAASEFRFDPVVGWRPRSGFEGPRCYGAFPVPVRVHTNRDGFRDSDWDERLARAKATGAKKILAIGDSVLYGFASERDQRLTEQLAAVYAREGRNVEIFNAGVPAYGASQEYRLLPLLLERIEPDVVLLVFVENDYGDTALPYDHRHPLRIYKPFYDARGRLILNERVPRRPSAVMSDTLVGGSFIWYSADWLYFYLQDLQYSRFDIPNRRNAPYPIEWYDGFMYQEDLKGRFPYVEQTVLALYSKMRDAVRARGGEFLVVLSRERVEYVVAEKLRRSGIEFVTAPPEERMYRFWMEILYDDHLNFLWAWFVANKIHSVLEGVPYDPGLKGLPQRDRVPTALDLRNDAESARYLFGEWGPSEPGGRWLNGSGAVMLRNPKPGAAHELVVRLKGRAAGGTYVLFDQHEAAVCRFGIPRGGATVTCPLPAAGNDPLLFLRFSARDRNDRAPGEGFSREDASAQFEQVAVIDGSQPD
jgi:hypothetical protein